MQQVFYRSSSYSSRPGMCGRFRWVTSLRVCMSHRRAFYTSGYWCQVSAVSRLRLVYCRGRFRRPAPSAMTITNQDNT